MELPKLVKTALFIVAFLCLCGSSYFQAQPNGEYMCILLFIVAISLVITATFLQAIINLKK